MFPGKRQRIAQRETLTGRATVGQRSHQARSWGSKERNTPHVVRTRNIRRDAKEPSRSHSDAAKSHSGAIRNQLNSHTIRQLAPIQGCRPPGPPSPLRDCLAVWRAINPGAFNRLCTGVSCTATPSRPARKIALWPRPNSTNSRAKSCTGWCNQGLRMAQKMERPADLSCHLSDFLTVASAGHHGRACTMLRISPRTHGNAVPAPIVRRLFDSLAGTCRSWGPAFPFPVFVRCTPRQPP